MPLANDLSKSTVPLEQNGTVIAVIEMSQSSWLVAGIVLGVELAVKNLGRYAASRAGCWP